nr:Proline--tRNA ligase [Chlamydiota bacterium]
PKPTEFHDFLLAEEGDRCPHSPDTYHIQRGIEVGHIFNLGTLYTEKLNALFQDEEGKMQPFWMGTYGIGIGRTAAACIEQHHDEKGIIWPLAIAPFKVFITAATTKNPELVKVAEEIYEQLQKLGVEPLLDDRNERLGLKLKDSDLIGIPYKIIIGRAFDQEGKVEIESRTGEKTLLIPDNLSSWIKELT